ncbi:MAG: phosphotransferase family protein [Natronomonas sp.]
MTESPQAVLAEVFPEASVQSVTTPSEGNRKRTAVVGLDDGRTVVVQQSPDAEALRTEMRVARAVATRTTIPVPAVLDVGRIDAHGYCVTEYVDGDNLHERFASLPSGRRERLARQFGHALAELHEAFPFERFGTVRAEDGTLRANGPDEYEPWLVGHGEAGVRALPAAFADLETPLLEAMRGPTARENPRPRLYPWDLRPGNALVESGELVAVLDWGEPLAAEAGLSVAKTEHLVADWYVEDPTRLRAAFRDGYSSVRPRPEPTRRERLIAVLRSAVDADGEVTRPGYPERTGDAAIAFHRNRLEALL